MSIKMTSEVDAMKTNEFLRRRKLRIQQVREQSKDIAKKIRQRASSEKFRHLVNLKANKETEYLEQQDKLIKKLEQLRSESVAQLGASHKNAAETANTETNWEAADVSKQRAIKAAAVLRRQKQDKLDERKKLLDRKLQAREIANEISREKSSTVANKLSRTTVKSTEEVHQATQTEAVTEQTTPEEPNDKKEEEVATNDMATQWGYDSWPNEWEPNIPSLPLPKNDSAKEPTSKSTEIQSEKRKRPNLFALSDEMPPSLCGGLSRCSEDTPSVKPSLTLVSDYIQNRDLRLREFDPKPSKQSTEDLQKLKQTILRSRTSRAEGSIANPVHVADCHVVPVPSWKAENNNCKFHTRELDQNQSMVENREFNTVTNSEINTIFKSIRQKPDLLPTPVLRESSPFKRNKVWPGSFSAKSSKSEKPPKKDSLEHVLGKKCSVTMYNHSTRDLRDVPCTDRKLVSRDHRADDDAYSQAMKVTSSEQIDKDKDHQKKLQDMRNKIAMTKQSVEKEYKDTLAFLKSLPKDKTKPIKNAYKDAKQERLQLEHRQNKLQHEYRKILKESRRQPTVKQTSNTKMANMCNSDNDDDLDANDLQYSWMPVPESDKGLAVHIIPTKIKEQKSGNTVKFSKIDSYHEYRSRHKHTPPTKDTSVNERKKVNEDDSIEDQDMESSNSSTYDDDASSYDDLRFENKKKSKSGHNDPCVEAERILIYKILNSRSDKRAKVKKKHSKTCVAHPPVFVKNVEQTFEKDNIVQPHSSDNTTAIDRDIDAPPLYVKEGIYKTVSKNGDNISSVCYTDEQKKQNSLKAETYNVNRPSDHTVEQEYAESQKKDIYQPTKHSSLSSFKTAPIDKASQQEQPRKKVEEANGLLPGGYVKVIDQNGQESGKFFIGATGFLKDDAYEVTIKLRKTDTNKADSKEIVNNSKEQVKKDDKPTETEPEKMHATSSIGVGDKEVQAKSPSEKHSVVDKGLNATFQDASTCPEINTQVKPVASVSVQTTLDSPELRQRMSSSTSTAYMSPPEVILPRYLRNNNYNSNSIASWNREVYILNHEQRLHQKKNSPKPKQRLSPVKHSCQKYIDLKTPPNTARSIGDYSHTRGYPSKKSPPVVIVPKTVKKRKCKRRNSTKACVKSHLENTERVLSTNLKAPPPSVSSLDPIVKRYVDKLLHLNKEGVTAIEVLNQECSSVNTPGSSVIDEPHNKDKLNSNIEPKICLEQIKQLIAQQISKKCEKDILMEYEKHENIGDTGMKENWAKKIPPCIPKKRSVHKVKSLNISRNLFLKKSSTKVKAASNVPSSCPVSGTSSRDNSDILSSILPKQKHRSKSSPSPRRPTTDNKIKHKTKSFEGISYNNFIIKNDSNTVKANDRVPPLTNTIKTKENDSTRTGASHGRNALSSSWDSDDLARKHPPGVPLHSSTQTACNIDEQITYVKMAEDKLENMEKIADLTEKCTKRLSNLAKVLEEVRKNKLPYNQSESASDTDQLSGKNSDTIPITLYEPIIEIKQKDMLNSPSSDYPTVIEQRSPVKLTKDFEKIDNVTDNVKKSSPKSSPRSKRPKSPVLKAKMCNVRSPTNGIAEQHLKGRPKPPPALSRCLKRTQEYVVPHELSTVVEVDSPISIKFKSQSAKCEDSLDIESEKNSKSINKVSLAEKKNVNNPDLLENNATNLTLLNEAENTAEDTKLKMMDLKHFNDIMLKPFISIQEYAKRCNLSKLEDGSNIEALLKGDVIADELSSLHSDGSLPDVIAELLKRNIISEPFKFETTSNINSTVSSDSTLSVLALSKVKRGKKKSSGSFLLNKDKLEETSDTLSGSSNPDLENAFKKLGMGWASSTLKKTKQHLALSSSSTNTSSSSISQYKLKNVPSKDFQVLVADSMSSIRNLTTTTGPNEPIGKLETDDGRKTAGQQTSTCNSYTVKEFLKNELAKRITFGDKSHTIDTGEEFVSLCETKMPEDMQRTPIREERSIDSNPRARTSTPVQLFKSLTYHSSSSSHNGLFSNADDLSSVKGTSNSMRHRSTSEKDDLTIPNCSLRTKKGLSSDCSRSDD